MNILIKKNKRVRYKLVFPFDEGLINVIKELDEREFDSSEEPKGWVIPLPSLFTLRTLLRANSGITWTFETPKLEADFLVAAKKHWVLLKQKRIEGEARELRNKTNVALKSTLKASVDFGVDFNSFLNEGITLYHHQKYTPIWLNTAKSGILAAEMGLGKSLMFLLAAEMDPKLKKVLIICPNSLKLTLAGEIEKFISQPYHVLGRGKLNQYSIDEAKYIIVNYEYFNRPPKVKKTETKGFFDPKVKLTDLGLDKIDLLICDESHRLKEVKSNTFKNIKKSVVNGQKKRPRIILSTGTPIKSNSREIFSQLHLLSPDEFPNQWKFEQTYCGAYRNPTFNQIMYDPRREKLVELKEKLDPYMLRIKKSDALDLPDKVFTKITLELSPAERKTYNEIEEGVANEIFGEDKVSKNPLTTLLRLREYTSQVKVKYLKELIEGQLEQGEKVVFVDFFKNTLKELYGIFEDVSVLHTGNQSTEERQEAVQSFSKPFGGKDLFIGSSGTCNAGITLTASHILYLNSGEYTVADCDQILDRIHRISQTNNCLYFFPVIEDSVDEFLYYALERKRKVFAKLIDGENYVSTANESVLSDILTQLKEKYANRRN